MAKTKSDYVAEGRKWHAQGAVRPLDKGTWQSAALRGGWDDAEWERQAAVQSRKAASAEKFGKERRVYADAARRRDMTITACQRRLRMHAL